MRSLVGRNAFCGQIRYNHVAVDDSLCGARSSRNIKRNYYYLRIDENVKSIAPLIIEAIAIRLGRGRVCSWIY